MHRSGEILVINWNMGVRKEGGVDIFFAGVGLAASWKLIKKGGAKLCGGIVVTIIRLIFVQNIQDILLAVPLELHPLHGIGLGTDILILAGKIPYNEHFYFIGCVLGGVIVRNPLSTPALSSEKRRGRPSTPSA